MAKKRTRIEVIKDILEVLRKNRKVKITHLIYKSNLSNNSIKPYLADLLKNKLIDKICDNEKNFFIITNKGEDFLKEYNKIKVFSEAYGL